MPSDSTKKQKKAASYHSGGYKKAKKEKASQEDKKEIIQDEKAADAASSQEDHKPLEKKRGTKRKATQISNTSKAEEEDHKKQRYILFVGNLPFDIEAEEIKQHFTDKTSQKAPLSVRLLTKKISSNDNSKPKSKGCAFVEFCTPAGLQRGLNFHHTEFKGRKINVEFTAGGGGNSEKRREKIKSKNESVEKERQEAILKKNKEKKQKQEKSGDEKGTLNQKAISNTVVTSHIHSDRAKMIENSSSKKLQRR